jgi:hypothetical protein
MQGGRAGSAIMSSCLVKGHAGLHQARRGAAAVIGAAHLRQASPYLQPDLDAQDGLASLCLVDKFPQPLHDDAGRCVPGRAARTVQWAAAAPPGIDRRSRRRLGGQSFRNHLMGSRTA